MKYCALCIIPDTRPNITLNEKGICNACVSHLSRRERDWSKREAAFQEMVHYAKSQSHGYDCLIPVSGGKDSHWQVIKCLEYGLNPLTLTYKSPFRNALGEKNLANLIALGVDHIDYQINPKVERKFLYQALVRYGSTAIPMHLAMINIPLKMAVKLQIPLVIWGENSASEYGGTEEEQKAFKMDENWIRKYGLAYGTKAQDWVGPELTQAELTPFFGPSDEALKQHGVYPIFLGHYFPWDTETSYQIARAHGFQERMEGPKTGYYNYADIDDDFISIHHYLKWYKFGFTRLFDNLSIEIRNGRMSRSEAIRMVREKGDQTPHEDIEKFCQFLGITKVHFFEIIEPFRNKDIWTFEEGKWKIRDFLIPDWNGWNEINPVLSL